ncbi:MAG: MerR family transcriptional regulator [Paracoccaceae bacterium]
MAKSAEAFRTISEVADWLGVPAHVLRFWESKFTQVKPVKRAGGRRYYRPADMALLGGIKKLLHDDGMTIKGVQKILREQGVKHVASFSAPLDGDAGADRDEVIESVAIAAEPAVGIAPSLAQDDEDGDEDDDEDDRPFAASEDLAEDDHAEPEESWVEATEPEDDDETDDLTFAAAAPEPEPEPENTLPAPPEPGEPASDTRVLEDFAAAPQAPEPFSEDAETVETAALPDDEPAVETVPAEDRAESEPAPEAAPVADAVVLPGFLHRAAAPAEDATAEDAEAAPPASPEPEPDPEPAPPRPEVIALPPDPQDDEIDAAPGLISALAARRGQSLSPDIAAEAARLRDTLVTLSSRLGIQRPGQHPE